jgi:magnesium-transporting ATPase (P-type)
MFDYLAVLISVIFGLALTYILTAWSRIIQFRRTSRPCWIQLSWSLNVIVYLLGVWWGMFWWKHLREWTIQEFLFLTGYAIILYMLAAILFPDEGMADARHEGHFFDNRRWFFGLLLLVHLVDIPETAAKQVSGLRGIPWQYAVAEPIFITIAAAGLASGNRRLHTLLAPAWLITILSYLTLTSLDRIVAR